MVLEEFQEEASQAQDFEDESVAVGAFVRAVRHGSSREKGTRLYPSLLGHGAPCPDIHWTSEAPISNIQWIGR